MKKLLVLCCFVGCATPAQPLSEPPPTKAPVLYAQKPLQYSYDYLAGYKFGYKLGHSFGVVDGLDFGNCVDKNSHLKTPDEIFRKCKHLIERNEDPGIKYE